MPQIKFSDEMRIRSMVNIINASSNLQLMILTGGIPDPIAAAHTDSMNYGASGTQLIVFEDAKISVNSNTGEITTTGSLASDYQGNSVSGTAGHFRLRGDRSIADINGAGGDNYWTLYGSIGLTTADDLVITDLNVDTATGKRYLISGLIFKLPESVTY